MTYLEEFERKIEKLTEKQKRLLFRFTNNEKNTTLVSEFCLTRQGLWNYENNVYKRIISPEIESFINIYLPFFQLFFIKEPRGKALFPQSIEKEIEKMMKENKEVFDENPTTVQFLLFVFNYIQKKRSVNDVFYYDFENDIIFRTKKESLFYKKWLSNIKKNIFQKGISYKENIFKEKLISEIIELQKIIKFSDNKIEELSQKIIDDLFWNEELEEFNFFLYKGEEEFYFNYYFYKKRNSNKMIYLLSYMEALLELKNTVSLEFTQEFLDEMIDFFEDINETKIDLLDSNRNVLITRFSETKPVVRFLVFKNNHYYFKDKFETIKKDGGR